MISLLRRILGIARDVEDFSASISLVYRKIDEKAKAQKDCLSDFAAMVSRLGSRVDALEKKGRAGEPWFAQMGVGAHCVVGLELEGGFDGRSPARARVVSICSPSGRELPVGEVVDRIRRIYGGPEVVVPRLEEIEWTEFPA